MSKQSSSSIDKYFIIYMYIVDFLRLYHLLKYLPISLVYTLSSLIARLFYLTLPTLRKDIYQSLKICFSKLPEEKIYQLVYEHLQYTIFHIFLISVLPFLSIHKFQNLFDYKDLKEIIEKYKDVNTIIIGSHFFSALLITLLADILFELEVTGCGSFACDEAIRLDRYSAKMKQRFHWDYHLPITISQKKPKNITAVKQLRNFLKVGKGALFVFSDIRLDNSNLDLSYQIGDGTLYTNRGLQFCIDNFKDLNCIIPVCLEYNNGRFKTNISEVMTPDNARTRYYETLLPEQIETNIAQWQLWFIAPTLMNNSAAKV